MAATQQPAPQEPSTSRDGGTSRIGGTGVRGNSFSNGPDRGALHRWPCSCRWCLDGSVPELSG